MPSLAAHLHMEYSFRSYLGSWLTHRPGLLFGYGALRTAEIKEGLRRLRQCFTKSA
jgi:DNA-binding transcriptional MocR family regulator